LVASGLLLVYSDGLSGCDSKTADGMLVHDGGRISEEQKAKINGHYYSYRGKKANKKAGGAPMMNPRVISEDPLAPRFLGEGHPV
jgi:hypothetical protein